VIASLNSTMRRGGEKRFGLCGGEKKRGGGFPPSRRSIVLFKLMGRTCDCFAQKTGGGGRDWVGGNRVLEEKFWGRGGLCSSFRSGSSVKNPSGKPYDEIYFSKKKRKKGGTCRLRTEGRRGTQSIASNSVSQWKGQSPNFKSKRWEKKTPERNLIPGKKRERGMHKLGHNL